MVRLMKSTCIAALVTLAAAPIWAEDLALLIGNQDYNDLADVRAGDDIAGAATGLARDGFRVVARSNADAVDMAEALGEFIARTVPEDNGRLLVILNGQFIHTLTDTYLLPVDAPQDTPLAALPRIGLPLSVLMPVLSEHQGRAVLILGQGNNSRDPMPYSVNGLGEVSVPNGVTAIFGSASDVSWFTATALTRPGVKLDEAAGRVSGLRTAGYLPSGFTFAATTSAGPGPVVPVQTPAPDDPAQEAKFWEATRQADTIAGYEAYLRRYPQGRNAADARKLITEIRTEPYRNERLAEDALNLTRDQRRQVQRNLSILDFDPRGIDGIFGRGSRAAIAAWQTRNRFSATSYLTPEQIGELARQADVRAAELEREAELRRLEQERQDRNYWQQTGAVGDEAGLRAYLARYPDGSYAELAGERLDAIEAQKRQQAQAAERRDWDVAVQTDTIPGYRGYLSNYPQGSFADEAKSRIDELQAENDQRGEIQAARALEESLGLNEQTRLLVENRLQALQLRPGKVDGEFDRDTRRAIRRYQQARNLPVTGFLNQATIVRILADSVLR